MSFALTERQLLDGSKTVTRRMGWKRLKPGDELLAVRRCMGLAKGQRQHVLGCIRVTDVRQEPLCRVARPGETALEGFPELTGAQFVDFFCKALKCDPTCRVTRIAFVRLETSTAPAYSEAPMPTPVRYTTEGPLRRRCGHQHKSLSSAVQCLDEDEAWCRGQGADGHTDREIVVLLGGGKKRPLNDDERAAVAAYRASMSKP